MSRPKSTTDKQTSQERIAAAIENVKIQFEAKKAIFPYNERHIKNYSPEKYGKRVLSRRKELKLTQAKCAKRTGVTPQKISQIENGQQKTINQDHLYLLCVVLECTPDYLLELTNSPEEAIDVRSDGTEIHTTCPLNFGERPSSVLAADLMTSVIWAASKKSYNEIPAALHQLIAILQSDNPELIHRFCLALEQLCIDYKVKVGYFDENEKYSYR